MILTLITVANIFFASILFFLWFVEKRKSRQIKTYIKGDESTADTGKRQIEKNEYRALTNKLFEIGELKKDKSGYWVWSKSGELLGSKLLKNKWNL